MKKKPVLLALLLLIVTAGLASASTPDGVTPANENVCDPLFGATPGLYGLCVAYCEAQDSDFEGAISAQCRAPNPPILSNYDRRKKAGDPDMPCIQTETACPCWTSEELAQLDNGTDPLSSCVDSIVTSVSQVFPIQIAASLAETGVEPNVNRSCTYFEFDGVAITSRTFNVTAEEADACRQQLLDQAAVGGFSCI